MDAGDEEGWYWEEGGEEEELERDEVVSPEEEVPNRKVSDATRKSQSGVRFGSIASASRPSLVKRRPSRASLSQDQQSPVLSKRRSAALVVHKDSGTLRRQSSPKV